MAPLLLDFGKIINLMVKAFKLRIMETYILETYEKDKDRDRGSCIMKMESFMMDNLKKISKMELELKYILMDINMKVHLS